MYSNIKISGISSKLASVAKFARSQTVIAAAVAATGLGLAGTGFGAVTDVTAITTKNTTGAPTVVTGVAGAGASYSIYNNSSYTYTMDYLSQDDAISSLTAGGKTYTTGATMGTVTADSVSSPTTNNNLVIWEAGTGTGANKSTVTLEGPAVSSFSQAFNSNNVLTGADNVFSNMGNAVGNNTNVRRIDVLFTGGISASASTAFSVFDRGPSTDHDSFEIAAITAESGGVPTAYGPLISAGLTDGTWGKTTITPPGMTEEQILRKNLNSSTNAFQPSDSTDQTVGGVLIPTSTLVAAGTTIYGYSIFSGDVPTSDSGSELVNYATLPAADSTSTGGGLDPLSTLGNLYTVQSSVPEPTTGTMALIAVGGYLARRTKRKAAL